MKESCKAVKQLLLQFRYWQNAMDSIQRSLESPELTKESKQFLRNQWAELFGLCGEIEKTIRLLPEEDCKILLWRYLSGQSWEEIADRIGCNLEQTEFLHQKALAAYAQAAK